VAGRYVRTLYMNRLPERTGPLWLQPLLRLNCEWRMNIYAHKLDKELFRKNLQKKQAQATANTYQSVMGQRSTPNQEEAEKAQEAATIGSELYTTNMEVFIANVDGSNVRQVTHYGQANWAPAYLPDSKRIIFASNHEYKRGFPFNMYTMNADGSNIEKISRDKGFDAFPMFSPDKKKIVFASNRNNGGTHDTNIFIADWVN